MSAEELANHVVTDDRPVEIRYATREKHQDPMVEALFVAYFTAGKDIGDIETLAEVAAAVGLDAAAVRAYLGGTDDDETIRSEDAFARQIGINGVPCFIVDRQYAISGAQPPEAFLEVFELAKQGGEQPADLATARR